MITKHNWAHIWTNLVNKHFNIGLLMTMHSFAPTKLHRIICAKISSIICKRWRIAFRHLTFITHFQLATQSNVYAVHLGLFALRLCNLATSCPLYLLQGIDMIYWPGSSENVGSLGYSTIKVPAQQMGGREEKETDTLWERLWKRGRNAWERGRSLSE